MPRRDPVATATLRAVAALEEYIEVSKAFRDTVVRNERAAAKLIRQLHRQGSVIEAFTAIEGAMDRPREMAEAADEFEAARRASRQALLALAKAEGASFSAVARQLGVSRQLVSRVAAEVSETSRPRRSKR